MVVIVVVLMFVTWVESEVHPEEAWHLIGIVLLSSKETASE